MANAETKGINLDELQREAEKLLALLEDRQLGMMTWNEFMHKRLVTLHALISAALTPVGLSVETSAKAENTYPLTVDYGRSMEDIVKLGRYYWANSNINSRNFPTKRKGTADVTVELIHFNKTISTDDALHELDRMGYRPAELRELLAFGEKYPDVQREFPIVALGSVWQSRSGHRPVPSLDRSGLERNLHLDWLGPGWNEFCRFAVVRK